MSYVDLTIRIDTDTDVRAVEESGRSRITTERYDSHYETSSRLTVWLGEADHDPQSRIEVASRLIDALTQLREQAVTELATATEVVAS